MPSVPKDERAVSKADRRLFFWTALAHGSARVLSKTASAPLERVKVCLQVSAAGVRTTSPTVGGGTGLLCSIVKTQGVTALWRGSGTHILGVCLGSLTRLAALSTSQMWAMPGGGQQYRGLDAYLRNCAFLYGAGVAALLIAYPFDVAYTCMAADMSSPRRFNGVFHFARVTTREHGVRVLYRGLPLCLATAVPFVAIATASHDLLAPHLLQRLGQAPEVDDGAIKVPPHLYPWNLLVGAAAGFTAQSVTYPLDTLRRRWQHACAGPPLAAPRDVRECFARIYAEGGWRAFYAGYTVNALKLAPELLVLSGAYLHINSSGFYV